MASQCVVFLSKTLSTFASVDSADEQLSALFGTPIRGVFVLGQSALWRNSTSNEQFFSRFFLVEQLKLRCKLLQNMLKIYDKPKLVK